MICFEVHINGKKACTAGIESEYGVLTSILTWVKRDLSKFPLEVRDTIQKEELNLNLAGHISHGENDNENLDWIRQSVSIGDEITIKIIEADNYDKPHKRRRSDPDFVEKQKRNYFNRLKKEDEKKNV